MRIFRILLSVCILMAATQPGTGQQKLYFAPDQISIPYQLFTLDNGLTLIVHEDHKAPIVAVNIWYHVGSKNEKANRTGFAHLFEHLMFNGSEHFNTDYFQALEGIGATDLNGTTSNDRTNYFQNVPTAALDQVLFLESDRMGHLLGAIDQAKLDEQRGVVQNEKRQGENRPYGREYDLITQATYPKGHPYSWTVIGSMEDLNAASLEDVHEWFKTYYGPSNAVLSIAGDVDPQDVLVRVKKYFGHIPPGPSISRPEVDIARRTENTRGFYEDLVPEARVTITWNVPQWGSPESVWFDLATDILSSGKTSRLYKKLIYDDQIASSVYAYIDPMEISSNLVMVGNAKPGKSIEEVEQAMLDVLNEFIRTGPTQEELDRVKSAYFARFMKGVERIGGFGGKSDILATNQVFGGSPDYYKKTLQYVAETTTDDIRKACLDWLSSGSYTLVCKPFPKLVAGEAGVDRSRIPDLGAPIPSSFPNLQKTTLKNGMTVLLASRKGTPTIEGKIVFDAGFASDMLSKPGLASLSMDMIDEGTKTMNTLQISDKLQLLGASLYAGSDLDASYVHFNTLKPAFEPTLDVLADILLNPAFPTKEFDRLKTDHINSIKREKLQPFGMALRVIPGVLYGKDHAYGNPINGTGFESALETITVEDVKRFYQSWLKPNNATLVLVGDLEMSQVVSMLESRFSDWKKGEVPKKNITPVKETSGQKIYLINRPESTQSLVIAAYVTLPYGKVSQPALNAMNNILGGDFVSRLNMNLREDKHWSYGAGSLVWDASAQRPFMAYVSVQMDKTAESIEEISKELREITTARPITPEEFKRVQNNMSLQLPGMWETNNSVAYSMVDLIKYRLPDDYNQTYDSKVRKLTQTEVQQVCNQIVKPDQVAWFVVGDKAKISGSLGKLGYELIELDADGNPAAGKN